MNELIVSYGITLESNMDSVKASIAETIAKYDVIVDESRISEAKELMATFNKDKKEFSATCKKYMDAVSEPITQFKSQQKEIEKMYDDGREKIADQVAKFEATKLKEIEIMIFGYRGEKCEEKNINAGSVSVIDLVMLSAVSQNKHGYSLSKKTTDAIDQRIQSIENEILKARLEAEEKSKRDRGIADKARIEAEEKARQREIELLARAEREKQEAILKAQREQAEAVERERLRVEREERIKFEQINARAIQDKPIAKQPEQPKQEATLPWEDTQPTRNDGKKVFTITATFEILAPEQTQHEKITAKLKGMIESAGITSLKNIEVV